jgi:S-(hydroxymethyl)glutathione dehydrogenase/alcohol dehydrogenase
VCRANGAPLVIEEISVDPPKAYEIRIKIICTSLCHTDLTFWRVKVPARPRLTSKKPTSTGAVFAN